MKWVVTGIILLILSLWLFDKHYQQYLDYSYYQIFAILSLLIGVPFFITGTVMYIFGG